MRPIASTITEIDHLDGDEVKFGISKGQEAWVMRSMADLYSNRELACIREYSTNAYDSNKEKALAEGTEVAPIHVTLPSAMNPYFTVQDYGVGMTERELKEVYTQFGDSTKRDSDEFNGMLGFGCKAAVAYTNSFTVEAVKDGVKSIGVVTRREDAMGGYLVTMKIVLSNMETNEPNGVKVQIPVHNASEFSTKAHDFYRFWQPGTVLVNGREPEWAVGDKIDDNLYYNAKQGDSYVVMGNVPYKITNPNALFPQGMNRISFVAYVPVGAVEFTPAREALKYSDHTKNSLQKIISDFVAKSVRLAKEEINSATNHAEAYESWTKWRKIIGHNQVDDLTFKGDKLVDEFPILAMRYDLNTWRRSNAGSVTKAAVSNQNVSLFVTGFTPALNSDHKKKTRDWLALKNITAEHVYYTHATKLGTPWVSPERIVDWQTIKDELPKPPKKPRGASVNAGRLAGTFDLITKAGREYEKDVPTTKPLYYIAVRDYNINQDLDYTLELFNYDTKVVLLPANRKDKFLRHYPHAIEILSELRSKVVFDGPSLLSKEAVEYLKLNWTERSRLGKMDENRVDDPELKRLIKICKNEAGYLKEYNRHQQLANVLGQGRNFKRHEWERSFDCKETPITKNYPLASNFGRDLKTDNHAYYYINAVYSARKAGKNV
jgi:hypothetical protein